MGGLKKIEAILVLAFFFICLFLFLYICRFLDNNTLVSWRWVFADVSIIKALLWLTAVLAAAGAVALWSWPERHPIPALIFLTLSAVVPLWGEPELLVDSGRYFMQAKHLSEYGPGFFVREWGRAIFAWTDLPLGPGLYGLLFRLFGETRLVVQVFNTGLMVLTIILIREIGMILWDRETGFYAGLMLLGMPYLLTQAPLMLVDVPTMFFLTLAIYLFLRAIIAGGIWLAFAPVAILAAMLMKYSVWPMLLLLLLTAAVIKTDDRRRLLCRAGMVLAAVALSAAWLAAARSDLFAAQLEILWSYQKPALSLWREGFISTFFFQINPLVVILAFFGGYRAWRGRDRHFLIVFFFFVFVFRVQRIRYILPLLPLLALMAGRGLRGVRLREIRAFVAFSIVLSSLLLLFGAYLPFFRTTSMMNLMRAGRFIDSLDGDAVLVQVRPQVESDGATIVAVPQLDLFTTRRIISRQDWSRQHSPLSPYAPLLFTSRLSRPRFYQGDDPDRDLPLVVIAADTAAPLSTRPLLRTFSRSSGVFRFKTFVRVYQ